MKMIPKIALSKWTQFIILMIFVLCLTVSSFFDFTAKERLQFLSFDTFNKIDPRQPTNDVMIVDIDEESLRILGQFPWPRDIVADLVKRMKGYGAKVIAFDMVFAEPDRASPHLLADEIGVPANALRNNDMVLEEAIKETGNVVTGFVVAKPEQTRRAPYVTSPVKIRRSDREDLLSWVFPLRGAATNLPEFPAAAAGNGIFLATPSSDGIIRQIPLLVRFDQTLYPTLSLEALRVAGDKREFLKVGQNKDANAHTAYNIQVGEQDLNVPIEADGKMWVKYRDMTDDDYLSAYKILDTRYQDEVTEKLSDKIVFIGTSAEGLKDIRSTPLNIFIPGVEIHVNVAEQILQGDYLYRFDAIAKQIEALFIFVVGFLIVILSLKAGALPLTFLMSGAIVAAVWGSFVSYVDHGYLFDPIYPSLCVIAIFMVTTILNYIRTETQAKEVKSAFGHYISPDFMKELTDNPDKLKLGGEQKELSVMFSDIRNFTTISESMTPEELINTMNDFLTPMSDVVMGTRGTIDKFMGDAMMAFWNAPLDDEDHARHAVQAALKMRHALTPVNQALAEKARKNGTIPLKLAAGIGVNTGPCSVGNMGSKQRFAYSALGDAVNLASRLEGQTKAYGLDLLIGEETYNQVRDFAIVEIDKIKVKGKTKPVRIFTALGDNHTGKKTAFKKFRVAHKLFLRDYRRMNFEGAANRVPDLMQNHYGQELKGYYEVMLNRMEEFQTTPPEANWDGVYEATSK